jgi:hypothetical protein
MLLPSHLNHHCILATMVNILTSHMPLGGPSLQKEVRFVPDISHIQVFEPSQVEPDRVLQ